MSYALTPWAKSGSSSPGDQTLRVMPAACAAASTILVSVRLGDGLAPEHPRLAIRVKQDLDPPEAVTVENPVGVERDQGDRLRELGRQVNTRRVPSPAPPSAQTLPVGHSVHQLEVRPRTLVTFSLRLRVSCSRRRSRAAAARRRSARRTPSDGTSPAPVRCRGRRPPPDRGGRLERHRPPAYRSAPPRCWCR